jgi:hypothetical protein
VAQGPGYAGVVRPLLLALAVATLLAGCTGPSTSLPVAGPPSPDEIALKSGDVPAGLTACPGSGPIDTYIQALQNRDPDGYASLKDAWDTLKRNGADAAAIVAYVGDPAVACVGSLGAGQGKSATSFVIRYRDSGSATTAYKRGLLQFPTPQQGQQTPGLTVGAATGLGSNSWVYEAAASGKAAYLAFWQVNQFDVMVLTADLDTADSRRAADAVNSRAR